MSDEEKAKMMREFVKAIESNDFEKAESLCSDDIVWYTPMSTFKGKEELKRYRCDPETEPPRLLAHEGGVYFLSYTQICDK